LYVINSFTVSLPQCAQKSNCATTAESGCEPNVLKTATEDVVEKTNHAVHHFESIATHKGCFGVLSGEAGGHLLQALNRRQGD